MDGEEIKKAADMVLETLGKKYPYKTIEDVNFHINVYVRILYHLIDKNIKKEHRTMVKWKISEFLCSERKDYEEEKISRTH